MTELFDTIISMFPSAMTSATPLIIAALGGLICERSGVVNIALEGIMLVGAFAAGAVTAVLQNNAMLGSVAGWVSLVASVLLGMLFSWLLAIAAVKFKADQTIAGTALNLLSVGVTVYAAELIFGEKRTPSMSNPIPRITKVPVLGDIPVIGRMFFSNIYSTFFIALILVAVVYFFVFKTRYGLRLRSCGENPQASASMGINVQRTRYVGVLLSGALGGLAGGIMVLTMNNQFSVTAINGYGFIAIAAVIFGKWKPLGVLGAAIFFGLSQSLQVYASMIPVLDKLPTQLYTTIPYVLTVIALIVFSGKSVGPKAAGEIYDSGKR